MSSNTDGFPPEWRDDRRMAALFSPFRERQTNPADWDSKMSFWQSAILEQCRARKTAVVPPLTTLQEWFRRDGKVPRGLPLVWEQLHKLGHLQPLPTDSGWLVWGWNVAQRLVGSGASRDVHSLCPQRLQEVETSILGHHVTTSEKHHFTSSVLERDVFRRQCSHLAEDDVTFSLAVQGLVRKGHLVESQLGTQKLIKFVDNGGSRKVSETEFGTLRLKTAARNLERDIEHLTSTVSKYESEARDLVKKGSKTAALSSLRRKRRAQSQVDQKWTMLENVQRLLDSLDQAESTALVVTAYQAGVAALRQSGVSLDETQRVMDDVSDALSDAEDVTQAVSGDVTQDVTQDVTLDETLEDELEQLLAEDVDDGQLLAALDGLAVEDHQLPTDGETPAKLQMEAL